MVAAQSSHRCSLRSRRRPLGRHHKKQSFDTHTHGKKSPNDDDRRQTCSAMQTPPTSSRRVSAARTASGPSASSASASSTAQPARKSLSTTSAARASASRSAVATPKPLASTPGKLAIHGHGLSATGAKRHHANIAVKLIGSGSGSMERRLPRRSRRRPGTHAHPMNQAARVPATGQSTVQKKELDAAMDRIEGWAAGNASVRPTRPCNGDSLE